MTSPETQPNAPDVTWSRTRVSTPKEEVNTERCGCSDQSVDDDRYPHRCGVAARSETANPSGSSEESEKVRRQRIEDKKDIFFPEKKVTSLESSVMFSIRSICLDFNFVWFRDHPKFRTFKRYLRVIPQASVNYGHMSCHMSHSSPSIGMY